MKVEIILNVLGVLLYFIMRFGGRKDKTTELSWSYWWNDNMQEILSTVIFNIALMIIFIEGGIQIDLKKLIPGLPEGIAFIGDLAVYFAIGAVVSHSAYELWKKRKLNVKK